MQTVRVYDAIELNRTRGKRESVFPTNLYYLPDNENNLGYRAAKLPMDEFGIRDGGGDQDKEIYPSGQPGWQATVMRPTVLFGVNKMFGLGLSETGDDGARRPSGGGCAVLYHAGTRLFRRRNQGRSWHRFRRCRSRVLIAKPAVSVSTSMCTRA